MARAAFVPSSPVAENCADLCRDVAAVLLEGDLPRLRFLLKNGCCADIRIDDPVRAGFHEELGQRTPALVAAAALGNVEAAKLLLSFGATIDARTHHEEDCFFSGTPFLRSGGSALTFAVHFGHDEMVDFLLLRGCDPNIGDRWRRTPLALACRDGSVPIVRRLLQEKSRLKLEAADWEKHDALFFAADNGFLEIVRLLKKAGARGKTPINWQAGLGHSACIGDLEGVKEALRQGAALNVKEAIMGDSPLHLACRYGQARIAVFLLDMGAVLDALNEWQETSLMLALKNKQTELVRLLLPRRPRVNLRNKFLDTPLQMAVRSEDPHLLKMLLSGGLTFSLRDINEARRLSKKVDNAELQAAFHQCFGTGSASGESNKPRSSFRD